MNAPWSILRCPRRKAESLSSFYLHYGPFFFIKGPTTFTEMVLRGCSLGLPNPRTALHFTFLAQPTPRLPSNSIRVGHTKHHFPLTPNLSKNTHSRTHHLKALQGPESPKEEGQGYLTENSPEENTETLGKGSQPEKKDDPKPTTSVGEGKGKNEELFLSGVLEEIQQIEWPVFGKVLGTTGVVLAVIAGSSVVLLTVNAVLAEISDRAFAGKGIQDFFG